MVILLNLVIAIIGDVFEEVNSIRLQCYYQERAKLIAEIWDIYDGWESKKVQKKNEANTLLYFAEENSVELIRANNASKLEDEKEEEAEEQADMIKEIHDTLMEMKTRKAEAKAGSSLKGRLKEGFEAQVLTKELLN